MSHTLSSSSRMDLAHSELEQLSVARNARRFMPDPLDVFCLTKHFMADTVVDPLVLPLPNEWFGRLSPAPTGSCYVKPICHQCQLELQGLAYALEKMTASWVNSHSYFQAAQELCELATGRDAHASTDAFLEHPHISWHIPVSASNNPYFGNLPDVCWPKY